MNLHPFLLPFVSTCLAVPLFVVAQEPDVTESDSAAAATQEALFLSRTRQLTFEGRRAGEGYFSADGSQLIFQSERSEENPFFQIFQLDRATGETRRISPGHGKTTCSWIHPDGQRVLFASTHEDPQAIAKQKEELAMRESGQERRYSWDYDEHFDIYQFDPSNDSYTNLTNETGYDAEASYSPDGKLIAFASNRFGYAGLSAKEQEQFERDPSWASEVCIMNADGSNLRRLTDTPGYDGGPFFSPDGQRICWRRFSEDGATAEIMTMDIDGSDQQQLTSLAAMSWAPYYHPSGRYLIFGTNKHGFANFELYLVDAGGKRDPVRVTHTAGFDGLPAFAPNGKQLSWTTNRAANPNGEKKSQIFIANWNHSAALKSLGLPAETQEATSDPAHATGRAPSRRTSYAPADAVRHVEYFCRPQLQGRLTGTRGEKLATNYVSLFFETLGLEPAGTDDNWFQPFDFTSGVSAGPDNTLIHNGNSIELDKQWRPLAFSATGEFEESNVIFAGYGIQAPAGEGFEEYDSFVHLDVKDKWVLCFRFMPEDISPEHRQYLARFSSLRFKAMKLRDLGAKGLVLVSGPTSEVRKQLIPLKFDGSLAGTSLPVLSVTDDLANSLLIDTKKTLKQLQQLLDDGSAVMGFPLKNARLAAKIDIQQEQRRGRNVLGRLQVGDEPSHEIVVVGAHIDHLGTGPSSGSLARDGESSQIHFGADDNASGVAAMLQIAEALATARDNGELNGHRDIVFAAWSGEELGLLGSSHYVKDLESLFAQHAADASAALDTNNEAEEEPTEKDDTEEARDELSGPTTGGLHMYIAACLNMDMVGRMQERLVLQGLGSSNEWRKLIEQTNVVAGLPITLQNDSYIPTDASVFFMHGVPILSAFTGTHSEYHTPRDTPEKLNYEGISEVAQFMGQICEALIVRDKMPAYVAQVGPNDGQRRANLRAWMGSIPDYAGSDVTGVLLSGVAKGGPCDKAGVKGGDVIVGLAGKKIENIYDYTYAIEALKIGQEIQIMLQRNERTIELKVTPGSRD
jgi:Tol biopolymer transport system component